LPDEIARLLALKVLYHNDNRIRDFTPLCQLFNLVVLYFADNQAGTIPESIANLAHLKVLNVAGNAIAGIQLHSASLRKVSLYLNPLQHLGGKLLERFRALPAGEKSDQYLYLDSRQRETVGKAVKGIACLKVLDLKKPELDYIEKIPIELYAKYGLKGSGHEWFKQKRINYSIGGVAFDE
jgi:Leucine-rich repeat (LRR) protein